MKKSILSFKSFGGVILMTLFSLYAFAQLPDHTYKKMTTQVHDTAYIMQLARQGISSMVAHRDSAVSLSRQALQLSAEADYRLGMVHALYGLGMYHSLQEEYDKCISYYTQTLNYAEQDSTLWKIINNCIFNIGEAFYRKGEFGLSAYYFYKSVYLAQLHYDAFSGKTILRAYNRLVAIWEHLKIPERALYYADLQENMAKYRQDTLSLATALSTKGTLYVNRQQYEKGLQYYSEALILEKSLGAKSNTSNQQVIINNIANIHIRQGHIPQGIHYAEEALRLSLDNNNLIGYISAHTTLGDAYLRLKQYKKAEQHLKNALKEAEKNGMKDKAAFLYMNLSNIHEIYKNYSQSLEYAQKYIYLKDSLRGEKNAAAAGMLELKYRTSEKDRQLAQKQVELLQHQSKIRTKNTWIAGISAGTLLLSITLITLYRNNRHKQRLQTNQIHMLRQEQELIRLRAVMKGEEQERGRIARELHDGIGGMLAAIKMNMNTVQEKNIRNGEQTDFGKLMRMMDETATEVRKTAHNLMPDILTRHSLAEALQIYCEHINTAGGLQVQLRLYGSLSGLDKHIELTLYRIIQELTQNIIKHANATEAVIEVSRAQEMIHITVEDNGRGFDPEVNRNGFGLQNLRHRVQALQGDISIESAPGIGTTILIEFDLNKLYHTFAT